MEGDGLIVNRFLDLRRNTTLNSVHMKSGPSLYGSGFVATNVTFHWKKDFVAQKVSLSRSERSPKSLANYMGSSLY